jgi:hypothetical protein
MSNIKTLVLLTITACALFASNAAASLISGRVSYNHNIGPATTTIDPANVGSTGTSSYKSNDEDLYAKFGTGYSTARIQSSRFRGSSKANSSHRINNIVISPMSGFAITPTPGFRLLPETNSGEFHASYSFKFSGIEFASSFRFGVDITGDSSPYDFSNLFYQSGIFGRTNVYTKVFDFQVNQSFDLQYDISMIVKNIEVEQSQFLGAGSYNFALGGSPVFVLPEGYTANAADGTIVNNYYVGFNPINANTPNVPEPSTFAIFALGITGLVSRKLRRFKA